MGSITFILKPGISDMKSVMIHNTNQVGDFNNRPVQLHLTGNNGMSVGRQDHTHQFQKYRLKHNPKTERERKGSVPWRQ